MVYANAKMFMETDGTWSYYEGESLTDDDSALLQILGVDKWSNSSITIGAKFDIPPWGPCIPYIDVRGTGQTRSDKCGHVDQGSSPGTGKATVVRLDGTAMQDGNRYTGTPDSGTLPESRPAIEEEEQLLVGLSQQEAQQEAQQAFIHHAIVSYSHWPEVLERNGKLPPPVLSFMITTDLAHA